MAQGKNTSPDLAEVVYEVFRCGHAHGDETPLEFQITKSDGGFFSEWELGPNTLRMPDRILWALTGIAVLSRVNYRIRGGEACWLSLGDEKFPIAEWWGRENDFRPIAARWNTTRVKTEGLGRMKDAPAASGGIKSTELVVIVSKPSETTDSASPS